MPCSEHEVSEIREFQCLKIQQNALNRVHFTHLVITFINHIIDDKTVCSEKIMHISQALLFIFEYMSLI